ncbi:hypothetical protein BT96DRAFT_1026741 [Gymnopus androsaceus JB14]|uniref:Uncharacterized protein n=1 Tax=Gymnopus androsaceus JB14 TaxID=1447944 RepID=A0A6A4GHY3_9AGAR|nr:hypothetical protein BT96DRAFT_1026741 [Gymnopus androsaceus JB14]
MAKKETPFSSGDPATPAHIEPTAEWLQEPLFMQGKPVRGGGGGALSCPGAGGGINENKADRGFTDDEKEPPVISLPSTLLASIVCNNKEFSTYLLEPGTPIVGPKPFDINAVLRKAVSSKTNNSHLTHQVTLEGDLSDLSNIEDNDDDVDLESEDKSSHSANTQTPTTSTAKPHSDKASGQGSAA